MKVSKSEKKYILDGVRQNLRIDGRQRLDYRSFIVETGVLCQANGSSRVRLFQTEVVVGVKLELGAPVSKYPKKGLLKINIECSPSLEEVVNLQEVSTALQETLDSALNLKALCIREGEACWILYVDCLVLDGYGNIFDALGTGIKAAIGNTLVPSVEVIDGEEGAEVVVSDDRNELKKLEIGEVPTFVTFGIFPDCFVVDPVLEEESCMESAISLGVLEGKVFSVHKRLSYGIHPNEMRQILKSGVKIGMELKKRVDEIIANVQISGDSGFFH